ncbi:MAG TPA: radical SAM protein [Deltaproteobacteria bacterium]|nr:radical SAM protein [Deltaproteobacteria bacterium]
MSNLGCPHRCVFCDQGQFSAPASPEDVPRLVHDFLSQCSRAQERRRIVAFFGGSFTGIDEEAFHAYLAATRDLIGQGVIHGAKASTRPDMVTGEILGLLKSSGFEELEIGVQSMDDRVLGASGRGHGSRDSLHACALVKASGLRLGVQLMPGLPGEDVRSFRATVDAVCAVAPDTARIYPTVVLAGTPLEVLHRSGRYHPLSLEDAIHRTLYAMVRLQGLGCTILRMGLPQSASLKVTAGPFHPAFGFLVKAHAFRIMATRAMDTLGGSCVLAVNPRDIPELVGHGRANKRELMFQYSFDEAIPRGYIRAQDGRESTCIQLQDILEYIP